MRHHSAYELENKLKRRGFEYQLIQRVLVFLEEYNLIDDYNYAKLLAEELLKKTRPVGLIRVKYELKKRGIDQAIISWVIAEIDNETEFAGAKKIVDKALANHRRKYTREKLAAMLERRGFSYDTIYKVLSCFK